MDQYQKIRKRVWYSRWETFAKFLNEEPDGREVLEAIHKLLDEISAYHSIRASQYSFDSLQQVLYDLGGNPERAESSAEWVGLQE